jgi:hypothetical protein
MKSLLLTILIIFSINSFSQEPNPDLFQTWYLYNIDASDAGTIPVYVISEVDPSISPTLTFMQDLSFNGVAACNTFNGNLSLLNSSQLNTQQFSFTTDDCGVQIHNNFESEYSEFIQSMITYSVYSVDNGMGLTIDTAIFGYATFRNYPLNITEHELQKIEIYPNPTNSLIHLKSQNNQIIKIEIFNSFEQSIKIIENNFDTLNISDLSNGFYILKIETEYGTVTKKIIKE